MRIIVPSPQSPETSDRAVSNGLGFLLPGSGLLSRLAALAGAANEDRPEPLRAAGSPRGPLLNRCEFDYDYYVELQSRRRQRRSLPARLEGSGQAV